MNFKYLFIAAACSLFSFSSCVNDEIDKDIPTICPGSTVPQNVIKNFYQIYGEVENPKWEFVNNYYVAHFNGPALTKSNDYTTSAWFTQEGKHCQVDQEIHFNQLPETVKIGFDSYVTKFYPDWKVDDCEIVSREGMGLIYVIEIEKGEQERELSFSENGDFLKDVLDENDNDFIYPIVVPDKLHGALTQLFPTSINISILEIEYDDDEIEVDILDGTRHKEVTFTPNLKWISTEYKVSMQEATTMIDPTVMQKLITLATSAGIDINDPLIQKNIDVEVIEDAYKGVYFEVEIEVGHIELEVIIDKDGNITIDD